MYVLQFCDSYIREIRAVEGWSYCSRLKYLQVQVYCMKQEGILDRNIRLYCPLFQ
jgi:hypothetical protein